eukprot:TRINITY_DN1977_c0_g1_i10.p1 TRINITY_DN1977_c0_g1~~TRINITY_DN1977_c0_g1_i10.p1  ORF type:complete len:229 (+),score=30.16 TRINITY_DN1977_c0_g1_i10:654-1340(+)
MAGGDESVYTLEAAKTSAAARGPVIETLTLPDSAQDNVNPDFAELRGSYWRLKRPIGLAIGLLAVVISLPAILVIAIVLAQQGRPVFIRRKRLGLHGHPFVSYYFRTMLPDSLRHYDPITGRLQPAMDKFGRFLLRTKLDHLPLLINVLRGNMNLVGPRPLSQEELIGAGRSARFSLSVRPGLTGLWWLHEETDLRRRLALDRSYIERASLSLDARIVARTLLMIHGG